MSLSALDEMMEKSENVLKELSSPSFDGVADVVLGNESCDLDSAVCALCLALLLHAEGKRVLPVLNIARQDFPLRTEVNFLLRQGGIAVERLVFRDDVDLSALRSSDRLRLTLVDHHVLPDADRALAACLAGVLDHRPRDPSQTFPPACEVDVRTVGSCATLVAERILQRAPHLLDRQVAGLIRGTVLLDTACFSPQADRTTPADVAVVEECERRLQDADSRDAVFERILDARKDVASLTSFQILHKDMKVVHGLPLPGMPILVRDFLSRPDASSALAEFCEKHHSSSAVVIGMSFQGDNLRRDLAVCSVSQDEQLAKQLVEVLLRDESLQLVPLPCELPGVKLFDQKNTKQSRKQILPLVQRALSSAATH